MSTKADIDFHSDSDNRVLMEIQEESLINRRRRGGENLEGNRWAS